MYYISEPEISPPQTIANSPLSGFMAIDASDGVPTVAHYDADTKDLHYSTLQSDNSWSTETINTEVNLLGTGSILSHKKYQDTPSVVYVEQTTGMLKMASNPGGAGWAIYNITDDTDGGTDTSLALHNGSFGIAFTSGNSSDISNGCLLYTSDAADE